MSKSDQAEFWAGEFGKDYISRNVSKHLHAANLSFFSKVISQMDREPDSILELGANVGMNFDALSLLVPEHSFTGVEINQTAFSFLKKKPCDAVLSSIEDFSTDDKFYLTLTKGVLIHLSPDSLRVAYEKLYTYSRKYILIAEYYSRNPEMVEYRGRKDVLFKRDFAGELLSLYSNLRLVTYGFEYHRGLFPQDDITWFLLRKESD
jgi:spore coat polysaccharide biosynthesis protein SpsF